MTDTIDFAWPELALAVLAASTAVLVVCLLLCRTALRRRPAARSAACTATTTVLVALPLVAVLVAAWDLGFAERSALGTGDPDRALDVDRQPARPLPASAVAGMGNDAGLTGSAPTSAPRVETAGVDPMDVAAAAWLSIAGLLLVPLGLSLLRVRRLRARACLAIDPAWNDARSRVARALDVRRGYELGASDAVGSAVAVGLLRPLVILPADVAARAPTPADEAVLAHEVAHVIRNDAARAVLSRLALALHWHHPLAWWLHREAAIACEEACDNHALAVVSPHAFAEKLLALSVGARTCPVGVLGHSVRGWSLERRVSDLLSGRRDPTRSASTVATVAIAAVLAAIGVGVIAGCTPNRATAPQPERVPARDPVDAHGLADARRPTGDPDADSVDDPVPVDPVRRPVLDPVLARLGFGDLATASLEFVYDHGGRGDAYRLADGRAVPGETDWTFADPSAVISALAGARTAEFGADRWVDAKAEFILTGTLHDGRRVQISFHSRPGRATVSRSTATDELEGGYWRFEGGDDALVALMRTRQPTTVELRRRAAHVWRLPAEGAPSAHEVRVARSAAELAQHLQALAPPADALAPDDFDYARGVALVIRTPPHDPARSLKWGYPVLRDGTVLEQLLFDWPDERADVATAPVLLLFVEVADPSALTEVAVTFPDDRRFAQPLTRAERR